MNFGTDLSGSHIGPERRSSLTVSNARWARSERAAGSGPRLGFGLLDRWRGDGSGTNGRGRLGVAPANKQNAEDEQQRNQNLPELVPEDV